MSVDIRELRSKQATLADGLQRILRETADRGIGTDELKEFNKLNTEYEELEARIRRAQEVEKKQDFLNQSIATAPDLGQPGGGESASAYSGGRPVAGPISYRSLFGGSGELESDGFHSMDDFMRAVVTKTDPRLSGLQKRAMSQGVGSEGGFLCPVGYAAEVFDAGIEESLVLPRASVWPMESNLLHIPALKIGDHSSNLYGGLIAYWMAEGSTATESKPEFRAMELKAKKLLAYGIISDECLADGVSMEQTVVKTFGEALSWTMDREFLTGTGAGQPLGVLNGACTITAEKESGQAASTLVYQNLTTMLSHLFPRSFKKAAWFCSNTCIPSLLELSIPIGTGGSHFPVLTESNGKWRMLALPVYFTEKLPALGTAGDVLLADFSQYAVGLRKEIVIDKSIHVKFPEDQIAFRAKVRVDGQPLWDQALTQKDGSHTVSPFVVVEDR